MPRLVTFGCSFVYGHALPDCHIPPDDHGPNPSKYAWPQLLAEKLGYECLNLSIPGSGNLQILMEVLKTKFDKDDLVILAFSYFLRFNMYQIVDMNGTGNLVKQETVIHKKLILESIGNKHSDEKNYWDNWLSIHHCEKFLESMNIKNMSYLGIPYGAQEHKPDLLQLSNFKNDLRLIIKDKALDDKHPGLESHRLQAELIYSKIQEHELH